jgi:hypothetical protein
MRFFTAVPLLAGVAYALTATTETVCSTAYGPKSVATIKSRTSAFTTLSTVTHSILSTPTVTVTPAVVTSIVTTTSTEVDVVDTQTTDTYTTTQYSTSTSTVGFLSLRFREQGF